MLLYVEGTSFLGRTFVVMCQEEDTVARIKAKLLHPLHDWGKATYQFRLRYKSRYLQDAVSLESQQVVDNAVVHMVALNSTAKCTGGNSSICSRNTQDVAKDLQDMGVLNALRSEVRQLERRTLLLQGLKVLIYLQLLFTPLLFASIYWWSGFWSAVFALYSFFYLPNFYYVGGVATVPNSLHFRFVIVNTVLSFLTAGASVAVWTLVLTSSSKLLDGCQTANQGQTLSLASDSCSSQVWFSAIIHPLHALINLAAALLSIFLGINLRFKIGDKLEDAFLKLRDIVQVIVVARSENSSASERREAAAQINGFVATSDDAKFQVVELEGLLSLINLSLTKDEETQVLASEALAMMLEVPAIQNEFMDKNGLSCLCALLRSANICVQTHACRALSLIVTDNAENAAKLADGTGLSDISYALCHAPPDAGEYIGDILTHLIAQRTLRTAIRDHRELFSGIVSEASVAGSSEKLTAVCLHCLTVLAVETPNILKEQIDLIPSLISMPRQTGDLDILLPTAKLLLCYAEDEALSSQLPLADLKETLGLLTSTRNQQLHHLTLEIVSVLLVKHREALLHHGFGSVVEEVVGVVRQRANMLQEEVASRARQVTVDTRTSYDKQIGTTDIIQNDAAIMEDDGDDEDGEGTDVVSPLLGSSGHQGTPVNADAYPDLHRFAQQLLTSLSVNGKRRPLVKGLSSVSMDSTSQHLPSSARGKPLNRLESALSIGSTASSRQR